MKKVFILFAVAFLMVVTGSAQKNSGTYNWGIGGKYVPQKFSSLEPIAVSIKHYTKAGDAFELLFTNHKEGSRGTFLFELSPALDANKKTIRFVIGPGVHVGYLKDAALEKHDKNPVVGLDGIIGLEWKVPKIPISLQVDYQPSADLIGNNETFADWAGATLRIAF
jgi:hypothetical protein